MSKARKAKWNIEENTREGYTRYSIRKYSMGVASVAVLSGFFFLTGISAQAAEITAPQIPAQTDANVLPTSKQALSKEAVEKKATVTKSTKEEVVTSTPKETKVEEKKEVTVTPVTTGSTREAKVETVSTTPKEDKVAEVTTTTPETREASTREAVNSESGYSGFRAARRLGPSRPAPSQPVNHSAATPTNTVAASAGTTNHDKVERLRVEDAIEPTDVSNGTHKFTGEGTARLNTPIHYNVTTTRTNGGLDVSINYSAPGNTREFVRNNFILHTGNGFGTPQLRSVSGTTGNPSIVKGENFMSHSGYTLASSVDTNRDQTVRFFLPISRPNADLTFKLQPTTFNVNQGGGSEATINDPYSNSNYYFKEQPLYLDANPSGTTSKRKVIKETIDFQTMYIPTTKLAEGETKVVRDGVNGERQITYKVHQYGSETVLGLPISNVITKEAQPRIVQIGVAKDLVDKPEVVKPRVDQNKVGDTNHLTFYLDKDGNNVYNEGVDELIQNIDIKDGAKGEKGDRGQQGERGLTGAQGAKGEKGDQGERGLTGAQGAKGEKGDRGERGLTGAQGVKGEKGDRGERGLTGAQGAKGEKGDQGERGQDGKSIVAVKNGNETKLYVENPAQPGQPLDPSHPLATITDGVNGRDGQSPTITATRTVQNGQNGVLITVTPVNGTPQSTFVKDGVNGQNGSTPTVTITEGQNGTRTLTVHNPGQPDVSTVIRDGAQGRQGERGLKGDKGEAGRDGVTPTVTVKDNKADGTHTITINDGRGNITNTIVKDGFNGKSPLVATNRNEDAKTTTVIFYYDENGNNELDASD